MSKGEKKLRTGKGRKGFKDTRLRKGTLREKEKVRVGEEDVALFLFWR